MTPTEDNYVVGMTFTKEYEPGNWCIATVKILGELYSVDGSNAPTVGGSNQGAD